MPPPVRFFSITAPDGTVLVDANGSNQIEDRVECYELIYEYAEDNAIYGTFTIYYHLNPKVAKRDSVVTVEAAPDLGTQPAPPEPEPPTPPEPEPTPEPDPEPDVGIIGIGTPPLESGENSWNDRINGDGVVWYTDFGNQAEVDKFRWSGGYGSGNDPLAKGSVASRMTHHTADSVTGGAALNIYRPTGTSDTDTYWWRPLSPFTSSGTGLDVDDPGAGIITPRTWSPTDGGSQTVNFGQSFYGHPDNQDNDFDGGDFWFQVRVKMDADRMNNSSAVGKLIWFTGTWATNTNQEIVVYSKGTGGNQGADKNYFRMYMGYAEGTQYIPMDDLSTGDGRIQVGSDSANDWYYSNGWDCLLFHVQPGADALMDSYIEIWAATEADITAGSGYTKIWSQMIPIDYDATASDSNGIAKPGYNAVILASYNNDNNMTDDFDHRFDQAIFSKLYIPCPNETQSDLAEAAASMSSGETLDFSGRGMTQNLIGEGAIGAGQSICEFSHKGYWNDLTQTVEFIGGSDYTGGVARHIKYDDATNLWSTVDTGLSSSFAHGYEHFALNTLNGDMYFRLYNSDAVWRKQPGDQTFSSWTTITSLGGTYSIASALEFHPWIGDQGGLVYIDGDWGTHVYDIGANIWTEVGSRVFANLHNGAAYLPKQRVVFVGGGNSDKKISQVNSAGTFSDRNDAPVDWNSSNGTAVMVADPGPKGDMLLFADNGNVYEHNYSADSWSIIDTHPFYSNANAEEWIAVIPITRYGVVMSFCETGSTPTVTLWKR